MTSQIYTYPELCCWFIALHISSQMIDLHHFDQPRLFCINSHYVKLNYLLNYILKYTFTFTFTFTFSLWTTLFPNKCPPSVWHQYIYIKEPHKYSIISMGRYCNGTLVCHQCTSGYLKASSYLYASGSWQRERQGITLCVSLPFTISQHWSHNHGSHELTFKVWNTESASKYVSEYHPHCTPSSPDLQKLWSVLR